VKQLPGRCSLLVEVPRVAAAAAVDDARGVRGAPRLLQYGCDVLAHETCGGDALRGIRDETDLDVQDEEDAVAGHGTWAKTHMSSKIIFATIRLTESSFPRTKGGNSAHIDLGYLRKVEKPLDELNAPKSNP
jgi:hypothetical protein